MILAVIVRPEVEEVGVSRNALSLTTEVLDEIVRHIVRVLDPEKIILFGSYARGDAGPDSDVDLAVIAETELPRGRRALGIGWPLRHLRLPLEVLVYTPQEWEQYIQVRTALPAIIERTGRTVYERERSPVGARAAMGA